MGMWVGGRVGMWVGGRVGRRVGSRVGRWVGGRVGMWVGGRVGRWVGGRVGMWVGGRVEEKTRGQGGRAGYVTPNASAVQSPLLYAHLNMCVRVNSHHTGGFRN